MNKASSVSCLGPTAAATLNNHLNHHPHTHPHFVAAHRPAPHHHHHHHHLQHHQPPPGNMLPFDSLALYEPQPKPRFYFKMPRVVPDQKNKFESDELFRRLSRESEVRYTGYRDRPLEERQMRFQNGCREGHTEIAFIATGTNLQLVFNPVANGYLPDMRDCDFDKEHGKITEVQERLRILQQQQQQPQDGMSAAGPYPMQPMQPPPMSGMSNQGPMYGPGPNLQMPQGMPGSDMPKTDLDKPTTKQKKKKERKPRESKGAGKGKKSKEQKDLVNLDLPPVVPPDPNQMSHEVYDFQDLPPELPEKKPKKPRKPREAKPPKEKKPKEPKPPKEKTPKSSKARKKKGQPDTTDVNSSSQPGEVTNDLDSLVPKSDEFPEPDQKNGIGAAGITAAEGGPSVPTCGGDGDTSTQEDGSGATGEITDAEAAPAAEVTTPVKPKKPKKPKLKSNSSSKKRPSKTMISLAKLKKRRKRSDSEGSDIDATSKSRPTRKQNFMQIFMQEMDFFTDWI